MATLIASIGLFGDIFDFFLPFILVFAIVYGILMKTKMLSERADVNSIVALTMGLMVVISGAGKFITTLTPLFAGFFIVIFMIFLIFLFFGVEKDIKSILMGNRMIAALIIIVCIIFVFYAIGSLYGSGLYSATGVSEGVNASVNQSVIGPETCDFTKIAGNVAVACLLGNPKVLGTLVLLGLMAIGTFFIMYVPKKFS